jgi:hypothetical protein
MALGLFVKSGGSEDSAFSRSLLTVTAFIVWLSLAGNEKQDTQISCLCSLAGMSSAVDGSQQALWHF